MTSLLLYGSCCVKFTSIGVSFAALMPKMLLNNAKLTRKYQEINYKICWFQQVYQGNKVTVMICIRFDRIGADWNTSLLQTKQIILTPSIQTPPSSDSTPSGLIRSVCAEHKETRGMFSEGHEQLWSLVKAGMSHVALLHPLIRRALQLRVGLVAIKEVSSVLRISPAGAQRTSTSDRNAQTFFLLGRGGCGSLQVEIGWLLTA